MSDLFIYLFVCTVKKVVLPPCCVINVKILQRRLQPVTCVNTKFIRACLMSDIIKCIHFYLMITVLFAADCFIGNPRVPA